jgi:pimeloyl-ACP methyl ester carboxylesterase
MTEIVELRDGRLASYHASGNGIPTLMLPGGPGLAAAYLDGDAALFPDTLRSYLFDQPGSGSSTPPADPSGYSAEEQARFFEEARRALGVSKVVVFGHSFGATVALAYAALYPESTAACVAVAPFAIGGDADAAEGGAAAAESETITQRHVTSSWYPEARQVLEEFGERVLNAADSAEMDQILYAILPFYLAHPDKPGMAARLAKARGALKTNLAAVRAWVGDIYPTIDMRPLLSRISCRTLIIAGEFDLVCGPAQARPIAERIPGSKLVIFPDCGHLPVFEAPGEYRKAVLDFFRGDAAL